jgi:hypothetical protein
MAFGEQLGLFVELLSAVLRAVSNGFPASRSISALLPEFWTPTTVELWAGGAILARF